MEMLVIAVIAIVAFALVLIPLFRRRPPSAADEREFETEPRTDVGQERPTAAGQVPEDAESPGIVAAQEDRIELEVQRYRVALRAGTVCRKCGQASPAASLFCFECGNRLPRADAREFE